jgi:capsular polysaccharide transport system permease protein
VREPLSEVPALAPGRSLEATRAHAKGLRQARGRRLARLLAIFVLLPTALAGMYYGLLATPQYESFSTFTVQSSELRPALGVEGLLNGMTGSGHDSLAVRDYTLSRDMLSLLDKQHGFLKHYRDPRHDWLARLGADASFEDAYDYFGDKIDADYDQVSGSLSLRVRAFSPDKAQDLASGVLKASEEMVNKLSERQRRDRTRYAETELKLAEERLQKARRSIVSLQQAKKDLNPLETAGAALAIRTGLEGELARARAELMQLKSFMRADAPQVLSANEKVKSLSAQVAGESLRLVDPQKPGLSATLADFEAAVTEKEFAEKAYAATLTALEMARADADRQHRYLAIIASPSRPDESTYPYRVRSVVAAFVLSFLLFGIVSLLAAAVREHARL